MYANSHNFSICNILYIDNSYSPLIFQGSYKPNIIMKNWTKKLDSLKSQC